MKVEITEKGARGPKGEYEIGDEVEVKGDTLPGYLVGKCRVVRVKKPGRPKVAVTNPKEGAVQQDAEGPQPKDGET